MNKVAHGIDSIVGQLFVMEDHLTVVDQLCVSDLIGDGFTTPFQDAIKAALGDSANDVIEIRKELQELFKEAEAWDKKKALTTEIVEDGSEGLSDQAGA